MHSSSTPGGPLSASGAPQLADGFRDTFTSQCIDTGEVTLHAVIGGDGPPLLLVHGWPETWYAWRHVMPALARDFEVIAVDQRGIGLSDKPAGGYDTGTQARDLAGLMDALGHQRFSVVGHDTGFTISYALAADHPERVDRVALAEIPGSPGAAPSPPVFVPGMINDRLWHLPFNRLHKINEQLVAGREDIFYRWEFAAAAKPLPDEIIDTTSGSSRTRTPSTAASSGTGRSTRRSPRTRSARPRGCRCPSWRSAGARSFGDHVADAMKPVADDVQGVVIADTGHFLAEESPDELLAALNAFMAPYRAAAAAGDRLRLA